MSRRIAASRWGGVAVGALVAYLAMSSEALGRGVLLAAPLFAVCVLLGVVLGELSVRAPDGAVRHAALEVRRVRDYLPGGLSRAVAAAVCWLTGLLLATTAAGSADDLGRAGRSLFRQCGAISSESRGPWAGSFYTAPLAMALLLGVALTVVALRRIVQRPRPADVTGRSARDDVSRQRAAEAVVGACGVMITVPLIGVSSVTAIGLLGISCRPSWWTVTGWVLAAAVPLWLTLLAWSASAILPARSARSQ